MNPLSPATIDRAIGALYVRIVNHDMALERPSEPDTERVREKIRIAKEADEKALNELIAYNRSL
ncbi:MAG: hypothetical protein ABIT76_08810 [Chthoniobacterales bacterium]